MNILSEFSLGPKTTPKIVWYLMVITCVVALLSATIQILFDFFELHPGPQDLFCLYWSGMKKGYLWQPITYLFVENHSDPLSLPYLTSLFFSIYILWVLGAAVLEVIEERFFLPLYLISGALSGIIALLTMPLSYDHYIVLTGLTAPLLTFFIIWGMALPEIDILLFFLIPVKIKWFVVTSVSLILLFKLFQQNLPSFTLSLSAIATGYLYAACFMGWHSPFPYTQRFDRWITAKSLHLSNYLPNWLRIQPIKQKNINGNTEQMSDDAFVDAMLEKISKEGENSLSWAEKQRFQKISDKKLF